MSGRWTHPICKRCFNFEYPTKRPIGLLIGEGETCCFCGEKTEDGIYTRHDPADPRLLCNAGQDHCDDTEEDYEIARQS